MRLGVHLLGSRAGYRTIGASTDLTEAERLALESLVFGQTTDAAFLASLEHEPSVLLRPLPTGRFALTRLFPGQTDDAGRTTLEMRSLILEGEDYQRLVKADLGKVLANAALWSARHFEAGRIVELANPPGGGIPSVGRGVLMVMDAFLRCQERGQATVLLDDSPEHRRVVLDFVRAIAKEDLFRMTWGVRLLSLAAAPSVATAAVGVDRSRRNTIGVDFRAAPATESIRYLLEHGAELAALPSARRLREAPIPTDDRSTGSGSGSARREAQRDHARRPLRGLPFVLIGAAVLFILLAVIMTVVLVSSRAGARFESDPGPPAPIDANRSAAPASPVRDGDPAQLPTGRRSVGEPPSRLPGDADRIPVPATGPSTQPPRAPTAPTHGAPIPAPPANAPPEPIAPQPTPSLPASTPPAAPPPADGGSGVPAPPTEATEPELSEQMILLERLAGERESAARLQAALKEETLALQKTLAGPRADVPWPDHPTQWSTEHCLAVEAALRKQMSTLTLLPLVFAADQVHALTSEQSRRFATRDEFLKAIPALVIGIEGIDAMLGDDLGNALATQQNAMSSMQRGNCARDLAVPLLRQSNELRQRLRPLIGTNRTGRPEDTVAGGNRKRLQAALRSGLQAYGDTLEPALAAALQPLAGK